MLLAVASSSDLRHSSSSCILKFSGTSSTRCVQDSNCPRAKVNMMDRILPPHPQNLTTTLYPEAHPSCPPLVLPACSVAFMKDLRPLRAWYSAEYWFTRPPKLFEYSKAGAWMWKLLPSAHLVRTSCFPCCGNLPHLFGSFHTFVMTFSFCTCLRLLCIYNECFVRQSCLAVRMVMPIITAPCLRS